MWLMYILMCFLFFKYCNSNILVASITKRQNLDLSDEHFIIYDHSCNYAQVFWTFSASLHKAEVIMQVL